MISGDWSAGVSVASGAAGVLPRGQAWARLRAAHAPGLGGRTEAARGKETMLMSSSGEEGFLDDRKRRRRKPWNEREITGPDVEFAQALRKVIGTMRLEVLERRSTLRGYPVSYHTILKAVNGRKPSIYRVDAISYALGLPLNDLRAAAGYPLLPEEKSRLSAVPMVGAEGAQHVVLTPGVVVDLYTPGGKNVVLTSDLLRVIEAAALYGEKSGGGEAGGEG